MSEDSKNENSLTLEKITKFVLIFGILCVSGAIGYSFTKPEEKDVIFSILNQDQKMKDYPTHSSTGVPITTFAFVENHLQEDKEFAIRIYQGNENVVHNVSITIDNNPNVEYLFNQTIFLSNEESWISEEIVVSFDNPGENQQIIIELWINSENGWEYMPEYMLNLKIDIL